MLYDILPPTVFMLSLGGIVVLLSRVVVRMQRAEVHASVRTAAEVPTSTGSVLRPAQKSVQAATNRAGHAVGLLRRSAGAATGAVRERVAQAKDWRTTRAEAKQVPVDARPDISELRTDRSDAAREPQVVEPAGGRAAALKDRLSGAAAAARSRVGEKVSASATAIRERRERKRQEAAVVEEAAAVVQEQAASDAPVKSVVTTRIVTEPEVEEKPKRRRGLMKKVSPVDAATAAIAKQEYQKAEDVLVAHIVKNPKDTAAYMLLGEAAVGRDDWAGAIEIYSQVANWEPDRPGVQAQLGSAAYQAGKFTQALQALQRAHEIDPTNREILADLLSIAQKMDSPALTSSFTEKIAALTADEKQAAKQPV